MINPPEPLGTLLVVVLVALPLAILFVAVGRRVRLRRELDASRRIALARFEKPGLTEDERAAVAYWTLHNRACRRRLTALGYGPTHVGHLQVCQCNGPQSAFDRAQAEIRRAS